MYWSAISIQPAYTQYVVLKSNSELSQTDMGDDEECLIPFSA